MPIQITSEQTIREIAVANPASVQVFETLGIDYCCGGNLSLTAACARANVSVETVIGSLNDCANAAAPDVPNNPSLRDLTQHIVGTHHGFVRRESPRIHALLNKVCEKHGRAHAELSELKTLFTTLTNELGEHMMKEERILFPYIEALEDGTEQPACFGSVESPIAAMVADHEDAGAILSKMRELSSGYRAPESACPTFQAMYRALEEFERDLHRHVHLENNILFPRAIAAERNRRTALAPAN